MRATYQRPGIGIRAQLGFTGHARPAPAAHFHSTVLVAAIVAGVVVVLTSRNELQSRATRSTTTWMPLRTALDTRYRTLDRGQQAGGVGPRARCTQIVGAGRHRVRRLAATRARRQRQLAGDRGQQPRGARPAARARGPRRAPAGRPNRGAGRGEHVRRAQAATGGDAVRRRGEPLRERAATGPPAASPPASSATVGPHLRRPRGLPFQRRRTAGRSGLESA